MRPRTTRSNLDILGDRLTIYCPDDCALHDASLASARWLFDFEAPKEPFPSQYCSLHRSACATHSADSQSSETLADAAAASTSVAMKPAPATLAPMIQSAVIRSPLAMPAEDRERSVDRRGPPQALRALGPPLCAPSQGSQRTRARLSVHRRSCPHRDTATNRPARR